MLKIDKNKITTLFIITIAISLPVWYSIIRKREETSKKEKEKKKMENKTTAELKERLVKIERARFYEEMADFMNWDLYHKYTNEIHKIQDELKKRGEL